MEAIFKYIATQVLIEPLALAIDRQHALAGITVIAIQTDVRLIVAYIID